MALLFFFRSWNESIVRKFFFPDFIIDMINKWYLVWYTALPTYLNILNVESCR